MGLEITGSGAQRVRFAGLAADVGEEDGRKILKAWLDTPFAGGRHERRVNKIRDYEQRHTRP